MHITPLAGDGSDRQWFRINCQNHTMVMVDHGIRRPDQTNEVDAYVQIGHHLREKGTPLPEIYFADTFSGLVCLQDLGDQHLQQFVIKAESEKAVVDLYKKVITKLRQMAFGGLRGFNPAWTWQTTTYDRKLILEKECRYFVDAFLNLYAGMDVLYCDLADEFDFLARETLSATLQGFMHRDFQSRNIMLKSSKLYFIDFQGGRIGPVQYDLASLLIDPYAALSQGAQDLLLAHYTDELSCRMRIDAEQFRRGYACCAITRNLQILGAFGHLSKKRGKAYFETYIPAALNTLRNNLKRFFPGNALTKLKKTVNNAALKSYGFPVQSKNNRP
jgi:aminoglycoside/choline kinase family phosphotransferase